MNGFRHSISVPILLVLVLLAATCSSQEWICEFSLLIPFHDGRLINQNVFERQTGSIVSRQDHITTGISHLAVALMAIDDLGRKNSSLVPDLQTSNADCTISFPIPVLFDSGRSPTNVTEGKKIWFNESMTCAVIGPIDNHAAQALGNALLQTNRPGLSYGASAPLLSNPYFYPEMVLGNVGWGDLILKTFQYLSANLRESVAVLYNPGDNLDFYDFETAFEKARVETNLQVVVSLIPTRSEEYLTTRLDAIKNAGIDTIVVALNRDDNLETFAAVADRLDMLTDNYLWIFMDSFLTPQDAAANLKKDTASSPSPALQRMLDRTRFFQVLDGLTPIVTGNLTSTQLNDTQSLSIKSETFLSQWRQRGSELIGVMNVMLRLAPGLEDIQVDDDFFEKTVPQYGSSFIYDAIIAMGITACNQEAVSEADFDGATAGTYRIANRTLDANAIHFGIFALQPVFERDGSNGAYDSFLSYEAVLVDITNKDGTWNILEREEVVYPPHYLSTATTVVGVILATLATIICLASWFFIFYFRKDRIVSVSQPEFLYMVCAGAIITSASIFFMSFDEADGWSEKKLDAACVIRAWLSNVGPLIVYLALFSKLYRVEKVTQFRRGQKIEVRHVMGPFAGIVFGAVVILVVWTIVDPPRWDRVFLESTLLREAPGTFGYCYDSVWFSLSLGIILVVAVVIALLMSLKTRHLPEDISDSRRVYQTLAAHLSILIVGFVGLVILFLLSSYNLIYVGYYLVSFSSSIGSVAFLIGPKVYYIWLKKKTGELPPGLQRGRTRISGMTLPTNVGSTSRFAANGNIPVSSLTTSGITHASAASGLHQSEAGSTWTLKGRSASTSSVTNTAPPYMSSMSMSTLPTATDGGRISDDKSTRSVQNYVDNRSTLSIQQDSVIDKSSLRLVKENENDENESDGGKSNSTNKSITLEQTETASGNPNKTDTTTAATTTAITPPPTNTTTNNDESMILSYHNNGNGINSNRNNESGRKSILLNSSNHNKSQKSSRNFGQNSVKFDTSLPVAVQDVVDT